MTALQVYIVFGWMALALAGLYFQVRFGWPWRSPVELRAMAWQVFWSNAVVWAEPIGFLVSGLSLWPTAVVLTVTIVVTVWRDVLLERAKTSVRRALREKE